MNMIHAEKLVYEYDKRDEEGNVIGTNRAIDGVDIDGYALLPFPIAVNSVFISFKVLSKTSCLLRYKALVLFR